MGIETMRPQAMPATGVAGFRRLSLFAAAGVAVLLGLGTWQLERKARKEDLLRTIAARSKQAPIDVEVAAARRAAGENLEYAPVRAKGRLLPERSLFYYAPGPQGPGYHVYAPLVIPSGKAVLINRGFLPAAERAVAVHARPSSGDTIEVVGLLRSPGSAGWFTPSNDPQQNLWYWRDLPAMARQALAPSTDVFPFFIEELARPAGSPRAPGEPAGGATRLDLPNRHLEYALTWYGLAAALIGVYLTLAWSRFRRTGS